MEFEAAELLPAIEVTTAPAPRFAVIWMHGLGASGAHFESIVPLLRLKNAPGVRFIFPHAPAIPMTCNGGMVISSWYDILSIGKTTRKIDEAGLLRSREAIRSLIRRETARGIPSGRIFLAGFSQGGAMAYATGLTHPEPLAGIIALSTYLPSSEVVVQEMSAASRDVSIFAAHGTLDDVVSPEFGELARDRLLGLGHPLEWHSFPMPHSVSIREIRAVGAWLRGRIDSLEIS